MILAEITFIIKLCMDELTSLASKHYQKKKTKSKNAHCQQSLQTNFTNTLTAPKMPQNNQSHKKKPPVPSDVNLSSAHAKVKLLSNKKTKMAPPGPAKNGNLSSRRESTGRESSGKTRKAKNKSLFMKSKLEALQMQKANEAGSFFPLTQQEKELQQYKSYLIAENGEKMQPEIQDFTSSRQEAANLPFDSIFVAKVPPRYHKFYEESQAASSREGISKRDWEAFEAVKLKNEELTNYVEELQGIQERILEEQQSKRKALEKKYQLQKMEMLREIRQLRDEQIRLNQTNATLQQLFNEGKQNLDIMTRRYNELASSTNPSLKKDHHSASVEAVQRRITELEQQIVRARNTMDYLTKQKKDSEVKLRACQSEKEEIKNKAEQMLELLKVIKASYDQ